MENVGPSGGEFPELNTESDITLQQLDLEQLRHDRFERNKAVMQAVSPAFAAQVLCENFQGGHPGESPEVEAAVCIQKWYRGYRGRKIYAEKLFEQFEKEEAEQLEKVRKQMEEGELLVENHQLEVLLDDNKTTRKNQNIHLRYSVITIQRAWRAYLEKKHTAEDSVKQGRNNGLEPQNSGRSGSFSVEDSGDTDTYEKDAKKDVKSSKDNVNTNTDIVNKEKNNETELAEINDCSEPAEESSLIFQNPLIGLEQGDLNLGKSKCQIVNEKKVKSKQTSLEKLSDESDQDFKRRMKKHIFLKDAQNFVERKKIDSSILPFDLHKYSEFSDRNNSNIEGTIDERGRCPVSGNSGTEMAEILTHSNESFSSVVNDITCDKIESSEAFCDIGNTDTIDSGIKSEFTSNAIKVKTDMDNLETADTSKEMSESMNGKAYMDKSGESVGGEKELNLMVDSGIQIESDCDASNDPKAPKTGDDEEIGPFEVYNIETALPNINWDTLEESLKKASEEEKQRQEARRNDREEIRKKLAMGFDDDDDDCDEDESSVYKKPSLQTRLQSGMNLQICFMNESPADTDSDHGRSPRQFEESDNNKMLPKVGDIVDSDNNLPSVTDLNRVKSDPTDRGEASNTTRLKPEIDVSKSKDRDFLSRQEQLQNEAKLALAQAGTMAHMQLEIEKQTKKKSPMADIVGIPGLGERRRKKLGLRKLQEMNLAQIQVLYNDLQTQIESLNEELVQLLMERDELHMEQDSMLVDVEDLTRRAEEIAEKALKTKPKEETTCNSLKGKLLRR